MMKRWSVGLQTWIIESNEIFFETSAFHMCFLCNSNATFKENTCDVTNGAFYIKHSKFGSRSFTLADQELW